MTTWDHRRRGGLPDPAGDVPDQGVGHRLLIGELRIRPTQRVCGGEQSTEEGGHVALGQGDADGAQSEAVGVLAAAQGPFAVRLLLGVLDAAVVGADAGGGGPGDLLHRAAQVAQFDAEFPLGDGGVGKQGAGVFLDDGEGVQGQVPGGLPRRGLQLPVSGGSEVHAGHLLPCLGVPETQ